jgi:hypothetical protein
MRLLTLALILALSPMVAWAEQGAGPTAAITMVPVKGGTFSFGTNDQSRLDKPRSPKRSGRRSWGTIPALPTRWVTIFPSIA